VHLVVVERVRSFVEGSSSDPKVTVSVGVATHRGGWDDDRGARCARRPRRLPGEVQRPELCRRAARGRPCRRGRTRPVRRLALDVIRASATPESGR
jgi:hypothetical protein